MLQVTVCVCVCVCVRERERAGGQLSLCVLEAHWPRCSLTVTYSAFPLHNYGNSFPSLGVPVGRHGLGRP
jgi:hypothetical protein